MSEAEVTAEVEEPVVVEHVTVVEEPSPAGEMLRFFALVIILGVVVLVVAAVRPLIFGRIVPAVMGEGITVPTAEPAAPDDQEGVETPEESTDAGEPDNEETTGAAGSTDEEPPPEENTAGEAETSAPAGEEMTGEGEAETPEEATNEGDAGETAESETATPTTHTIQQGETLQSIAGQYGITLQQLIAANNLPNPDYIRIGDKLVIPQAEGVE